jgi:signal transduction histidine kinase
MLKQGRVPSEERRQEYYDLILRETARLTRLAETVLDSARLEDGHERLYHFEPIETTAWLTRVAADFHEEIAGSGVSLITAIPADLPLLVGDDEALSAAVHNLVDSAVKYSPGRPAVWLSAEASEGRVTVCVRDEGVGISQEDAPHVFERHYRGCGETTRQVKGSGLGLALVKHIVAAHDGTVEFASRPGEGTAFLLRLPAAAVAERA